MRNSKEYIRTMEMIEQFNEEFGIDEVLDILGIETKGNSTAKSCCCPLHGGDNPNGASIHLRNNIFTCWTADCGRGIKPFEFVKKYFNLDFKGTLQKCNDLFGTHFPIFEKGNDPKGNKPKYRRKQDKFDRVIETEKYLSEVNNILAEEVLTYRNVLLNANTGVGKTYGVTELSKEFVECCDLENYMTVVTALKVDLVVFLVPNRSIAEQVADRFPHFKLFYGDNEVFPNSKYVVSTYAKVKSVQRHIEYQEIDIRYRENPFKYMMVVDEIHTIVNMRNLLNKKGVANTIEQLISNATYSIGMSANTFGVNQAYKGKGLFNRYIKVEQRERSYNSNELNIYRLPAKDKAKIKAIVDKMCEDLKTYSNILYMEDDKKNLEILARVLEDRGIECSFITATNKNEEDIEETYNDIVINGKLSKKVILTTSLINAGVSVDNANVSVMVKQNRSQLDFDKIQQYFARIRSDENNKLTLFLVQNSDKKVTENSQKYVKSFNPIHEYYLETSKRLSIEFNEYFFNAYGISMSEYEEIYMKDIFTTCCNGGRYADVDGCLFAEGEMLKVDEIACYNKARLEWYSENYYNDEFIIEMLQDVNVRKINKVIYIDTVANVDTIENLESKSIKEALLEVTSNEEDIREFYKFINNDKSIEEVESELIIALHENFKTDSKYRSILSTIRKVLKMLSHVEDTNKEIVFYSLISAYCLETNKETESQIRSIKRINLYNKIAPIGDTEKANILEDDIYRFVRKNYDCFAVNKNKPSKTAFTCTINDYCDYYGMKKEELPIRKGSSKKDLYYVNGKKKILVSELEQQIKYCVDEIYNIADSGRITKLK